MTQQPKNPIGVTVAVNVDGETKVFSADAASEANQFRVAEGLLDSLYRDAGDWLRDARHGASGRLL
jgi:hypothetical protein